MHGSRARTRGIIQLYQFGNDMYNLLAVDGPANQQKGSASAAYWLPTNSEYRCDYVARQIGVERQVRADRHHAGKAGDAFRAAQLPRAGIAGKLKLIPV